ncbi:MAG: aminotransferase class I/II-fold pyridoxal phosphate-dependent enzyme [Acidobacteria bacterium]|nr:aminotransferase class I/II-fold pyridoxal phosphate-dependent enzyme [Acidobacteriota bacterium]
MKHKMDTLCVHAGTSENEHFAAVSPIYQTSTFKFRDADHGAALFAGKEEGYIYSRMLNPTVKSLEDAVAVLENGHKGLGTASGMAAINTTFMAFVKAGDHVVCSESVYGPTSTSLEKVLVEFGVEHTFVDTSDLNAVKNAVQANTKMIYVETPGNPTLVVSDIAEIAKIAHDAGTLLVVDNTFSSPVVQLPLDHGADIVVHSMTKFLNGHADVVAGMIVVKTEDQYKKCRYILNHLGGIIPPFEAYLVLRGIKTLSIRMKKHCESAQEIAEYLEAHPAVSWVKYPGLASHPQHEIAKKQMNGYSGIISFELKGGLTAGKHMMNSVKIAQLAVSLGGVESLIQHPASMTHAGMPKELREQAGITDGLVRVSVGIEDVNELIADLDQSMV